MSAVNRSKNQCAECGAVLEGASYDHDSKCSQFPVTPGSPDWPTGMPGTTAFSTMLEDFDRYWQSEDGWARFWDLAQNKGSKATDWKLAVEAAFAAGYAARTPTISRGNSKK